MRLYYYRDPIGNFGDELNAWLWPRLLGQRIDDQPGWLFVGIGTILNDAVPCTPGKVVFGSGAGYGNVPVLDPRWVFYCVRGPLTADRLRLDRSLAVTDPGALVRRFMRRASSPQSKFALVPHHESCIRAEIEGTNLKRVCADLGVVLIDPTQSVDDVIGRMATCEFVLAEAMHAAIVADALRIPWVPVRLFDHILDFKWQDWCASMRLDYKSVDMVVADAAEREIGVQEGLKQLLKQARPILSSEALLEDRIAELESRLGEFRRDVDAGRFSASFAQPEEARTSTGQHTGYEWWHRRAELMRDLESLVRPEETCILADEEQLGLGAWGAVRLLPFLEREGSYWGTPANDHQAWTELERMRDRGAGYFALAWPAFWWKECFGVFASRLESAFDCVMSNERLLVFDLRKTKSTGVES